MSEDSKQPSDSGSVAAHCSSSDWEYEQNVDYFDPETECCRCWGSGEVPTMDYESYTGQEYKPCPDCNGSGRINE